MSSELGKFYSGDFKVLRDALISVDKSLLEKLHNYSKIGYYAISDEVFPKHLIYFLRGTSHWCNLFEDYKNLSGNEALEKFFSGYCEQDWSLTEHRLNNIKGIMFESLKANDFPREMEIMDEFLSSWLCGTDYDHEAPELLIRVFKDYFSHLGPVYRGIKLESMDDLNLLDNLSFKSYTELPKVAEHFSNNPSTMQLKYSVVISGRAGSGFLLYKFILKYKNITDDNNLKKLIEEFAHEQEILVKGPLTEVELKVTNNGTNQVGVMELSAVSSNPLI